MSEPTWDIEEALTEDAPPGACYFDINAGRWVSPSPPPIGPEVAERLDEHAERIRKERERRQWLAERGWT